ncbi:MAG: rhodanese-like domain-containing protein [Spirochaetales bacterium]|nr:rhodanese-like domain-containing protein [Spirochaetales bacterium]
MKVHYLVISYILVLALSCSNSSNSAAAQSTDYTSYDGLAALMKEKKQGSDFFLIDVRTPEEYAGGHIPGAILVPYETITTGIPTEDRGALIILYCRSGRRSGVAMEALQAAGYTNVYNFGGIANWEGELNEGPGP